MAELSTKAKKTQNIIDVLLSGGSDKATPLTAEKFLKIWKYYDADGTGIVKKNSWFTF